MANDPSKLQNQNDPLAALAAPQAPAVLPSHIEKMLEIMMAREVRLAAKEQAEEIARDAKNKQRELNAQNHTEKDLLRQARCTHLKGGKKGPRSGVRDFAVYLHTYINAEQVIKCFLCKMAWKVNDTIQTLRRKGRNVPNHTKIGWVEANAMLQQTTNTPSSSEIPLQATPQAALANGEND